MAGPGPTDLLDWKKLKVVHSTRIRLLILSLYLAPFIIFVVGFVAKCLEHLIFPSTTKSCFHNYIGFLPKIQIVKATFYIEEGSQVRFPYSQIILNVSDRVVKDSVYRSMCHKCLLIIIYRYAI